MIYLSLACYKIKRYNRNYHSFLKILMPVELGGMKYGLKSNA